MKRGIKLKRLNSKEKSALELIYAGEELPSNIRKSIFLAGPTPRSEDVQSWRKEAIEILNDLNFDGTIFIPEPRDGKAYPDYINQVDWETKMLDLCDCILFWIPRSKDLPALTTNIEWGKYQRSEKIAMGFPKDSEHNRYIEYECKNLGITVSDTLEDTIKYAIDLLGEGSYREEGECYVPLNIWGTSMFQNWYKSQKESGNELRFAKVNYVFKMPIMKQIFLWVLYVQVYIKDEDRIKDNEFVISRTDISSIVIYKKDKEDILNSDIVLVKEFRSPANNSKSMVYEVPGGSSFKDNSDINQVIQDEIEEETGLVFNKDRIIYEGSRQLMATLSSHKCHLFSVEINDEELEDIKSQVGSVHGVEEDTERTYLEIYKIKDLLKSDFVDWSNIGYILSILNK
jgi:8-oxo-dGTP pyrophosphatase MutT (NUDIX family)